MSNQPTHTLGADPEFFIELNNKLYSIVGLLGGSKHKPKPLDKDGLFTCQEDNVAAEYNIPASKTKEEFIWNIQWPINEIANLLGTKNFTISTKASGVFDKKQLQTPESQEFGCDPDFDAWALAVNNKPYCANKNFRTCGGHIHFGLTQEEQTQENIIRIIRNMDETLGVWSVIVDQDTERRKLYGKAGAFRFQPHGGEYRVLSNFWIFHPELISEVWDRTQFAINKPEIDPQKGKEVQQIINTGNINAARLYLSTNGLT